jgi:hypothetical protein
MRGQKRRITEVLPSTAGKFGNEEMKLADMVRLLLNLKEWRKREIENQGVEQIEVAEQIRYWVYSMSPSPDSTPSLDVQLKSSRVFSLLSCLLSACSVFTLKSSRFVLLLLAAVGVRFCSTVVTNSPTLVTCPDWRI